MNVDRRSPASPVWRRRWRSAGLLAGCFEPLYGEKSLVGGPGLSQRLKSIAVDPIRARAGTPAARIAVELQNDLIFDLTGGVGPAEQDPPAQRHPDDAEPAGDRRHHHRAAGRAAVRHQRQLYAGRARHRQIVVTGSTFARVSYDNPGQQQRFANARGQRDAENRAAKAISDNIKSRLASYFAAGT